MQRLVIIAWQEDTHLINAILGDLTFLKENVSWFLKIYLWKLIPLDPTSIGYHLSLIDFVLLVCLKARDSLWYLDSGCLGTWWVASPNLLTLCQRKEYMSLFETIIREKLWEKETLEISTRQIKNVLYVNGVKHSLLSIS